MIRRPPRSTRMTHSFPTRRSSDLAIARPNTPANSRNMIRLALVVAASARAPRKRPTHIELIEPLSDCRMFEPSIGNANNSRPRPTGPATRSIPPLCAAVAAGFTATTPARSNQQVTDGSVGFHRQCPPALDLQPHRLLHGQAHPRDRIGTAGEMKAGTHAASCITGHHHRNAFDGMRSEEHTSELQ